MLILARRSGERIMIGEEVILSVVSIDRRGKVRLGFEAPPHVRITREELMENRSVDGVGKAPLAARSEP